jgi:N-formylglutamate deformylase
MTAPDWLSIRRGGAPIIVTMPHTGAELGPPERRFVSPWRARKDADWHIEALYDFAADYDATIVRTALSRSLIDVNRDPSGASLYPGQATTELCPTTTFDGEPLYREGEKPDAAEIEERKRLWFAPYHEALGAPRSPACVRAARASSSTIATRSVRTSGGCSRANWRSSTSERTAARAPIQP